MKKIFFLALASLFSFTKIIAQDSLPPAYPIVSDTAELQLISDNYWQLLVIKNEQWTIEQVSKAPVTGKFQYKNSAAATADTLVKKYWFRYRLVNNMNREANISLSTGADYADFYISAQPADTWKHYSTGRLQAMDKRDGFKMALSIPITLAPAEEITVYYLASNTYTKPIRNFRLGFAGTRKIYDHYIDEMDNGDEYHAGYEIIEGFMIGFLLMAFFYSLYFFFIVKEKIYLYFSLFVIFLSIMRLYNILLHYFTREAPSLSQYVPLLSYSWAFINFFLIQFVRYFFKTFIKYKWWDRFLFFLAIINILVHLLLLLTNSSHLSIATPVYLVYANLGVIIQLALLITLFLYTKTSSSLNRLVILGAFPLFFMGGILGWLNPEFSDFGKTHFPAITNWLTKNFRVMEAICVLWFVLLFSVLLFIRYNALRKENAQKQLDSERFAKEKEMEKNELIQQQKIQLEKDVAERTAELKQSLENLKLSQSQLIQSEKMASLGELTAGIAHEIQNPLNFVNNFSEVSNELLDEMKDELTKGNYDDAKEIANDVKQNLEKINHHGKRADAIVKGMLQHSRSSSGVKEPTDINALCDEYLRLSYHGLRAKDKSFNATMKTDFDNSIGNINIIPQDIGRVVLNLLTNAFYVVDEKKTLRQAQGDSHYEPTVTIATRYIQPPLGGQSVEIKVSDNGGGIPQKVLDKIFQPFFTTKPTGQGTGLGLSLSYDIITKGHGGELKVETKEGEGSQFIINLPV